jgi:hypothetical protein
LAQRETRGSARTDQPSSKEKCRVLARQDRFGLLLEPCGKTTITVAAVDLLAYDVVMKIAGISAFAALAIATAAASTATLSLNSQNDKLSQRYDSLRQQYANATRPLNYHAHVDVRTSFITWAAKGLVDPVIIIGDSITEMEQLPATIAGHPVVNAGIGGAAVGDFVLRAPTLLNGVKPALIVVALGMNDRGTDIQAGYASLLALLKPMTPRLLSVAVTPAEGVDPINAGIKAAAALAGVVVVDTGAPAGQTEDGIHPNHTALAVIVPNLVQAIATALQTPARGA